MGKLLTRREAAERLGISVRALARLIAAGELAVVEVGPRTSRVVDRDIDEFIEARRRRRGATGSLTPEGRARLFERRNGLRGRRPRGKGSVLARLRPGAEGGGA